MPVTVTIPLAVLAPGARDFGPAAVPDGDSQVTVTVDRTVSHGGVQGLNGQPAATTVTLRSSQSGDGGVTWQDLAVNTVTGGIFTKGGTQINTDHVVTGLNPGTGRQVKATVTVTGASVAVAGSLATA